MDKTSVLKLTFMKWLYFSNKCYVTKDLIPLGIRIETSIGTEERNLIKRTSFALSLPLKNESKIKSTYCYY